MEQFSWQKEGGKNVSISKPGQKVIIFNKVWGFFHLCKMDRNAEAHQQEHCSAGRQPITNSYEIHGAIVAFSPVHHSHQL